MKRHEPCAHLRPDYDRMEVAQYITRDPDTGEISWEPTGLEAELMRLGLLAPIAKQTRVFRNAQDPDN